MLFRSATGPTLPEFKLKDSTGKSVQKVLSITVNAAPIPLAILTNSITPWTINQFNAFALSPNGGTSPYTWDLKAGSPPLPTGLSLNGSTGLINGTAFAGGTFTGVISVHNMVGTTKTQSFSITIARINQTVTFTSAPT